MFQHHAFKHSKFVVLSQSDKTTYLSFKLQDYFNINNQYCPDVNGFSQKVFTHQVSMNDYYFDVSKLFEPYTLVQYKQFVGQPIRMNETLKRLLKQRDLEHAFKNCFETFVMPIFSKLKAETIAKKQEEIVRISEHKKVVEEQEKIIKAKKDAEKEKENKLAQLRASVLAMGAEWEEYE